MTRNLEHIENLVVRYPILESCQKDIIESYLILEDCFRKGGKLLVAGNGGSSSDALHIVGELMKSFILQRPLSIELSEKIQKNSNHANYLVKNLQMALPAIALVGEISLMTAYNNDVSADLVFAQQVLGYGRVNDVFLGISTSGNSQNIIYATEVAKAIGIKRIGLTGRGGGSLNALCDICIKVPEDDTYKIQELHLPVYHALCMELEKTNFS